MEWAARFVANASKVLGNLGQSTAEIPSCVSPFPDNSFVFGGADSPKHLRCWVDWYGTTAPGTIFECLVVLFTSLDDQATASLWETNHQTVKITILPVHKSRFPGLPLNTLADLCESVLDWLERENPTGAIRRVFLGGFKNSSRPLLFYLIFQIWRQEGVDLMTLIESLEQQEEENQLRKTKQTTFTQSLHASSASLKINQLFPSQLRLLRHWSHLVNSLRIDYTPQCLAVRSVKLVGLELSVKHHSTVVGEVNEGGNSIPLVEIFLSDTAVWSSRPSQSIVWTQINESEVGSLKVFPGTFVRTPAPSGYSDIDWVAKITNGPKANGDFMIRILPNPSNDYDSVFALARRRDEGSAATFPNGVNLSPPQWMLRIQLHSSMFSEVSSGRFKIHLQNFDIDGYDIIADQLKALNPSEQQPNQQSVNVNLSLEFDLSDDFKTSPILSNIRSRLHAHLNDA